MTRLLPYPLLAASLLLMWVLLNDASAEHLILGAVIGVGASNTMVAFRPSKPRIKHWSMIAQLIGIVFVDIVRSNIAVGGIIFHGRRHPVTSGFVTIPLAIHDPTALAVLACILTSTPGTASVEYRSQYNTLLIHVLDLVEEQDWIDLIKGRYEPLLQEIFE